MVKDIASWAELRYNHGHLPSAMGYRTTYEIESEFMGLVKAV